MGPQKFRLFLSEGRLCSDLKSHSTNVEVLKGHGDIVKMKEVSMQKWRRIPFACCGHLLQKWTLVFGSRFANP